MRATKRIKSALYRVSWNWNHCILWLYSQTNMLHTASLTAGGGRRLFSPRQKPVLVSDFFTLFLAAPSKICHFLPIF